MKPTKPDRSRSSYKQVNLPFGNRAQTGLEPGGIVKTALKLGGELVHVHPEGVGPGSGRPDQVREAPMLEKKK